MQLPAAVGTTVIARTPTGRGTWQSQRCSIVKQGILKTMGGLADCPIKLSNRLGQPTLRIKATRRVLGSQYCSVMICGD
jgi:hypothetical protein